MALTEISVDTLITVPTDFATVDLALASLKNCWINNDVMVTIKLLGRQSFTAPIKLRHPQGGNIKLEGEATSTRSATVVSIAGSAGNYSTTVNFSTTGLHVGDLAGFEATAGTGKHKLHRGCHELIAINSPSQGVLKVTHFEPIAPNGSTGLIRVYPTQLVFTDCDFIEGGCLGGTPNVAFRGVNSGTPNYINMGILARDRYNAAPGVILIGPKTLISGVSADGLRPNAGGSITATETTISNCGNNGANNRDSGELNLFNCVISGNGYGGFASVGGGNGLMTQCGSATYIYGCEFIGNAGNNVYSRTQSSTLNDNAAPLYSLGGKFGLACYGGGFIQAQGATIESPRLNCVEFRNGSNAVLNNSIFISPGYNAITCWSGSFCEAGGVNISGVPAGQWAFYATDCSGINKAESTGQNNASATNSSFVR